MQKQPQQQPQQQQPMPQTHKQFRQLQTKPIKRFQNVWKPNTVWSWRRARFIRCVGRKMEHFYSPVTVEEVLNVAARLATNQLKSWLSTATLLAVLSAGLASVQLASNIEIIKFPATRCNVDRNRHIYRHGFTMCVQNPNQPGENLLWSLRDLSRKCYFQQDCCAKCEPTRIVGQFVSKVSDNTVCIELLEQGDALTLDQAFSILRSAKTPKLQAAMLQQSNSVVNAIQRSVFKSNKASRQLQNGPHSNRESH